MTDTDKELARQWANTFASDSKFASGRANHYAAARYILATLADVERLTKERDEARKVVEGLMGLAPLDKKPAAEDAELDAAIKKMDDYGVADESMDWAIAVEEAIELLAERVKEMRR